MEIKRKSIGIKWWTGLRIPAVSLGLGVLLIGFSTRIVKAGESPEKVLEKFNAASTYAEASKYITGRLKEQMERISKRKSRMLAKVLKSGQVKRYDVRMLSAKGNSQIMLITNIEIADEKKRQSDVPLIYEFLKENNEWKIEWRQSAMGILELYTRKVFPSQFHSKNSFQVDGKSFLMESVVASYEDKESGKNKWINIKFFPFKFQERDIEYLKYSHGPTVQDIDKATALASSMKYPVIRLDLQMDSNKNISAFSFGWEYREGDKIISKVIGPPINTCGIKEFKISDKVFTLTAEGTSQSLGNRPDETWNIHIVSLPLLKKGF